jgi:hypothetical protein
MKFLTYLTCFTVVFVTSCYSMEEAEIHMQRVESKKGTKTNPAPVLKRSRSLSGDSTSPDKTSKTNKVSASDGDISIPPEIMERIKNNADKLKPQLEQASTSLELINKSLKTKAEGFAKTNYRRTAELLGICGRVRGMLGSTLGVLRNLNGYSLKGENPLVNRSLAIIASGALQNQYEELIVYLSDKPDTKDIDCTVLKSVRAAIYDVTKDIPNFPIEEYDD